MDWPSIILATFLIATLGSALVLTGIVFFRLFRQPFEDEEVQNKEKAEDSKVYQWIYPLMIAAAIVISLWKTKYIDEMTFSTVLLPVFFAAWFIIRFRSKKEKTGLAFADIFRRPRENAGLLAIFVFLILLTVIFITPMIVLKYY
jgi:hypothetical protein